MAFLFPKACESTSGIGRPFLFIDMIRLPLSAGRTASRSDVRPTCLQIVAFPSIRLSRRLVGGWKSDELMSLQDNKLITKMIYVHHRFIKPLAPKKWCRVRCVLSFFISPILLLKGWWRRKLLFLFMFIYTFIISSKYQNFSSCILFTV